MHSLGFFYYPHWLRDSASPRCGIFIRMFMNAKYLLSLTVDIILRLLNLQLFKIEDIYITFIDKKNINALAPFGQFGSLLVLLGPSGSFCVLFWCFGSFQFMLGSFWSFMVLLGPYRSFLVVLCPLQCKLFCKKYFSTLVLAYKNK